MKKAYSLIEIMIVIALIGALLMIAAPKYKNFIAKTRRVEALINLHNIFAIEQSFWTENGRYTADLNELDWRPEGKPKYSYGFVGQENKNYFVGSMKTMAIPSQCTANTDSFTACALADIDGDGKFDILTINQNSELIIISDDLK